MTNEELFNKFLEIENKETNIFDKKCAIKKLENEFKTTEYSKEFPEINIFEAYDEFLKDYGSMSSMINRIKDDLPSLVNQLGSKLSLANMFNEMDASSKELMETLLSNIK